jgi:hypothetical protein
MGNLFTNSTGTGILDSTIVVKSLLNLIVAGVHDKRNEEQV